MSHELTSWFRAAETGDIRFIARNYVRYSRKAEEDYPCQTALMKASASRQLSVIKLLLNHEKRLTTGYGWTALMSATEAGHEDIIEILAPHEANFRTTKFYKAFRPATTALLIAATKGLDTCVNILYPYEKESSSWNDLFMAAYFVLPATVETNLLHRNAVDAYGRTPLMYAVMARRGAEQRQDLGRVIKKLVRYQDGAIDYYGKTALHYATEADNVDAVRYLLALSSTEVCKRIVSAERVSNLGKSALMIAAERGSAELCQLLAKREVGLTTPSGVTALMYAAKTGSLDIVVLLAQFEVRFTTTSPFEDFPVGTSALMIATYYKHDAIVDFLTRFEAEIRNQNNETFERYARATGDPLAASLGLPSLNDRSSTQDYDEDVPPIPGLTEPPLQKLSTVSQSPSGASPAGAHATPLGSAEVRSSDAQSPGARDAAGDAAGDSAQTTRSGLSATESSLVESAMRNVENIGNWGRQSRLGRAAPGAPGASGSAAASALDGASSVHASDLYSVAELQQSPARELRAAQDEAARLREENAHLRARLSALTQELAEARAHAGAAPDAGAADGASESAALREEVSKLQSIIFINTAIFEERLCKIEVEKMRLEEILHETAAKNETFTRLFHDLDELASEYSAAAALSPGRAAQGASRLAASATAATLAAAGDASSEHAGPPEGPEGLPAAEGAAGDAALGTLVRSLVSESNKLSVLITSALEASASTSAAIDGTRGVCALTQSVISEAGQPPGGAGGATGMSVYTPLVARTGTGTDAGAGAGASVQSTGVMAHSAHGSASAAQDLSSSTIVLNINDLTRHITGSLLSETSSASQARGAAVRTGAGAGANTGAGVGAAKSPAGPYRLNPFRDSANMGEHDTDQHQVYRSTHLSSAAHSSKESLDGAALVVHTPASAPTSAHPHQSLASRLMASLLSSVVSDAHGDAQGAQGAQGREQDLQRRCSALAAENTGLLRNVEQKTLAISALERRIEELQAAAAAHRAEIARLTLAASQGAAGSELTMREICHDDAAVRGAALEGAPLSASTLSQDEADSSVDAPAPSAEILNRLVETNDRLGGIERILATLRMRRQALAASAASTATDANAAGSLAHSRAIDQEMGVLEHEVSALVGSLQASLARSGGEAAQSAAPAAGAPGAAGAASALRESTRNLADSLSVQPSDGEDILGNIDSLAYVKQQFDSKLAVLKERVLRYKAQKDELRRQERRAAAENRELAGQLAASLRRAQDYEARAADLERSVARLEGELAALRARQAALEDVVDEKNASIGALEDRTRDVSARLDAERAAGAALRASLGEKTAAEARLSQELETLGRDLASKQHEADGLNSSLRDLNATVASLLANLEGASQTLAAEKERARAEAGELNSAIAAYKGECTEKDAAAAQLQESLREQEARIAQSVATIAELRRRIAELEEQSRRDREKFRGDAARLQRCFADTAETVSAFSRDYEAPCST